MISSDVVGVFQAFTPKFVKKYDNLAERTINAFAAYAQDVREGRFPDENYVYNMVEGELPKLKEMLKK